MTTDRFKTMREVYTEAVALAPALRARFEAAGLAPGKLQSIDDLNRLTVLKKERLMELQQLQPPFAGYLSGGEMQMLLIARALLAQARILMLDEPSMGLAPMLVEQLFEAIGRIKREQGLTVLLVEQNARAAIRQCDYGYVMDGGRIVLHGTREQLESNQDVKEFYLGLSLAEGRRNFRDVKHYRRRKRWLG